MLDCKILFVDDNEFNRIVMQDMLEMLFEGFTIHVYESAQEVLHSNVDVYDIILSDIDMPHINGFEFYDILRQECHFNKPIIAVTALTVRGDKEKMLMHGFDNYISKPVDMNTLEEIIKKHI